MGDSIVSLSFNHINNDNDIVSMSVLSKRFKFTLEYNLVAI